MGHNEEGEGNSSRGNEWEVVALTASAYAAAPGPGQVELNDNDQGNATKEDEAETSHAMFMSGHFIFPPSQHENLPLEPQGTEIQNIEGNEDDDSELHAEEGGRSVSKDDLEGLAMPDEFPGIQFFDEKGSRLSIHETEFSEGLNLIEEMEKEQSLYSDSKFSSFHGETTMDRSTLYEENTVMLEQTETSEEGLDSDISLFAKPSKEDKYDNSEPPCDSWWKRRAASLYAHAKETNALWSIFIAAAVMGLVILGHRWQQERWKALQLKSQFNINDEKTGRMLGSISRFKDVVVGGNRRGSFIRASSSTEL